jgi:hypothetical protein
MTFADEVHISLDKRLQGAGYTARLSANENEVVYRSATYEVVVYFDVPNMEMDARVRRVGEPGPWSYIRDIVPESEWPEEVYQEEIGPRPTTEIMNDLGHLIERLPA